MADPLQRKPDHHPRTASRVFSGEAVVITPAENKVRMLNPAGSRSVTEIVAVLTEEFDVEPARAEHTTLELLDILAEQGLILWK